MGARFSNKRLAMVCVAFLIVSFASPVLACTWDPYVNKCHPGHNEVVVYNNGSCKGTDYFSFNGNNQLEYPDVSNYEYNSGGNLSDTISCIVVGHRTKFYYYEHTNFGGASATLFNSYIDRLVQKGLGGTWWNDKISSVKVFSY